MSTTHTVAVYLTDRAYGGPEEGGWYYDCGELVKIIRTFRCEDAAFAFARRFNEVMDRTMNRGRRPISSVLSTGRYAAEVCERVAESYPESRPHYE